MMIFWLCAVAMVAAALWFVLPPLIGSASDRGPSRAQVNLDIYKERLRELALQEEFGTVDAAQSARSRDELDREMLALVTESPAAAEQTGQARQPHPLRAIAIAISLPLLAVATYLQVGAPRLLVDTPTPAAVEHSAGEAAPLSVEQMVAGLEQRLQAQPDDIRGWLMLGRSYSVMKRHEDARVALAQALKRAPDNPDVMVGYAEVLTTLNKGSLDGEPIALVNRALAINNDFPRALWLAGVHALNQGIASQALGFWQTILDTTGLDPSVRTQVTQAMQSVRSSAAERGLSTKGGASPTSAQQVGQGVGKSNGSGPGAGLSNSQSDGPSNGPGNGPSNGQIRAQGSAEVAASADAMPMTSSDARATVHGEAGVTVNVSLSPKLAASLTGTETVFVFARAPHGPPMPLAAQRLTANELPITVVLDDSKSMSPQFAISSVDAVVITARVSLAGTPRAAPGDLQGSSAEIATRGAQSVDVEINQRVK